MDQLAKQKKAQEQERQKSSNKIKQAIKSKNIRDIYTLGVTENQRPASTLQAAIRRHYGSCGKAPSGHFIINFHRIWCW